MSFRLPCLALIAAAFAPHTPAFADGPRIVADCAAPKPAAGVSFSGPVLQVIDGRRVCVALSPDPKDWIEVAPVGVTPVSSGDDDARALLMASTFSRRIDCVAEDPRGRAVAAVCTVDGLTLTDALQAQKAGPEWKTWR